MQGRPFKVKPDGGLNGVTEPSKPMKTSPPCPIVASYVAGVNVPPVAVMVTVPLKALETVGRVASVNEADQLLSAAVVVLMMVTSAMKPGL